MAKTRQQLKQARLEMLDEEHRLASAAIVDKLKAADDWSKVTSLHYFEPLPELAEVDINAFIIYLEDNYPKLKLATSRKIEKRWEIVGAHGGQPPEQFDVVVVPMLGFDPKTLHRVGYGGGYYDKFLASQPKAKKIGVCFEQGKINNLLHQAHDIALDVVLTEVRAFN